MGGCGTCPNIPRRARYVRELSHDPEVAIVRIPPHRVVNTKRRLINVSVCGVRRSRESIPSERSPHLVKIPGEIGAAVIAVNGGLRISLPFEATDSGSRMNSGQCTVRPDDDIRAGGACNVTTATVAVEARGDEPEILDQLDVQRSCAAATVNRRVRRVTRGDGARRRGDHVDSLKCSKEPGNVEVYLVSARFGVESDLGNDVGVNIGRIRIVYSRRTARVSAIGVKLRCVTGNRRRPTRYDYRTGKRLLWIFERDAERHMLAGMHDEPNSRLPCPGQSQLVVRVHVLR